MAANWLTRWALLLSQYDYSIEYRRTTNHGNAGALSRLPVGSDADFDREEDDENEVNAVKTQSLQVNATDPGVLRKESSKDPVIAAAIRYTQEGWPESDATTNCELSLKYSVANFQRIHTSLSCQNGCLFYGSRIVIPQGLQDQILQLLHLGHFGIQRMKQLARTVVYWARIDDDIANTCRNCTACAEHQNNSPKAVNHPWIMLEKPWSRIYIDHAINLMGKNWLIMVDAYSKYPCIRPTTSVGTKAIKFAGRRICTLWFSTHHCIGQCDHFQI